MGDLTKNFSKSEFACPCCGLDDIDLKLVENLQLLRNKIGVPIIIHRGGGCRCQSYSERVSIVPNTSLHNIRNGCKAADCHAVDMSDKTLKRFAKELDQFLNGGIGSYYWGLHLDVRGHRARW